MSRCLTWVPISGLGEPKLYQNLGCFTRMWGGLWKVSDLCRISGGYLQGMMGLDYCFVPDELYLTRKMS